MPVLDGKDQYYYLVSGLPELGMPELIAERKIEEILSWIGNNLRGRDKVGFNYLSYRNDNKNLLYILRRQEGISEEPFWNFHKPAIFSRIELEEGLHAMLKLPEYMELFLREQRDPSSAVHGLRRENRLTDLYFQGAVKLCDKFLREYFHFKRDLKNIMSALNARKYGYSIADVVIGDYDLVDQLRNNVASDFGLQHSHAYVSELIELIELQDFRKLELRIDGILSDYLDSVADQDRFSAEFVLSYAVKLSLKARWIELGDGDGMKALGNITQRVVRSGVWPEELNQEDWIATGAKIQ